MSAVRGRQLGKPQEVYDEAGGHLSGRLPGRPDELLSGGGLVRIQDRAAPDQGNYATNDRWSTSGFSRSLENMGADRLLTAAARTSQATGRSSSTCPRRSTWRSRRGAAYELSSPDTIYKVLHKERGARGRPIMGGAHEAPRIADSNRWLRG